MKNLVLAHYYTIPQVQQMADFVGDSLELSLRAKESKAERIIFAGVKFMAETAKIINPHAEVILPDAESTCSLVTQTNINKLTDDIKDMRMFDGWDNPTIVTYINSSYELKAISNVIVTSANVEQIIQDLISRGEYVYFTPDRNMGAYLAHNNPQWGRRFTYYSEAVCEVHDKFKASEINKVMNEWSDYGKLLLAHPESPLPVLKRANFVGSTSKMLKFVEKYKFNATIYVATEEGLLYNMRKARPDLDIRLAPTYSGCQCNACPYMAKNTVSSVMQAIYKPNSGLEIDYIPEDVRLRALKPIQRMLKWI